MKSLSIGAFLTLVLSPGSSGLWNWKYFNCPYHGGKCFDPLPRHLFYNGKIYTVDPNDPNWDRYFKSFNCYDSV